MAADDSLDRLKELLVGKTIARVDDPGAREAICKVTCTDGSAFRLHATDLGFWTELTVAEGQGYTDLAVMVVDVEHYVYRLHHKVNPITVSIIDKSLTIKAPDGKCFKADIGHFDEWGQRVCAHRFAFNLIQNACEVGDGANFVFHHSNRIRELAQT